MKANGIEQVNLFDKLAEGHLHHEMMHLQVCFDRTAENAVTQCHIRLLDSLAVEEVNHLLGGVRR
jgi:hypothetical protein